MSPPAAQAVAGQAKALIEARAVSKRYGAFQALDRVSTGRGYYEAQLKKFRQAMRNE